jgi:hypothetical protein
MQFLRPLISFRNSNSPSDINSSRRTRSALCDHDSDRFGRRRRRRDLHNLCDGLHTHYGCHNGGGYRAGAHHRLHRRVGARDGGDLRQGETHHLRRVRRAAIRTGAIAVFAGCVGCALRVVVTDSSCC